MRTHHVLKQIGVEGSEEGLTTIANTISDALIMGDKSAINLSTPNYMAQGINEQEAARKAYTDAVNGLALDTLGSMVSDSFAGSFGSAQGRTNNTAQDTTQPVQQDTRPVQPIHQVQPEVVQPVQPVPQTIQPMEIAQPNMAAQFIETAIETDGAENTPAMQETIWQYPGNVDRGLVDYVKQSASSESNSLKPYELNTVSDRAASDIRNKLNTY